MKDSYEVECSYCGCKTFQLEFTGTHIKAYCETCGETVKNDYANSYYNTYFVQQIEDTPCEEGATKKQLGYIKFCSYHKNEWLSKEDAGDIIGIFEKAEKRGVSFDAESEYCEDYEEE